MLRNWKEPVIKELYRHITIHSFSHVAKLHLSLSHQEYLICVVLPHGRLVGPEIQFHRDIEKVLHLLSNIHTIIYMSGIFGSSEERFQHITNHLFPAFPPSVSTFYFIVCITAIFPLLQLIYFSTATNLRSYQSNQGHTSI